MVQKLIAFITGIILFLSAAPFHNGRTPAQARAAANDPYAVASAFLCAAYYKVFLR